MAVERKVLTAEELSALSDEGVRYELVNGELRTMTPAGGPHGRDTMRVSYHLSGHIYANDLGEAFGAETGFLIRHDPDTVRAPDFAFVRTGRLPADGVPAGYGEIAPDLVVEVVSPLDTAADVREKVDAWLQFGCRAVWIIYPGPRLDAYLADGSARAHWPDDDVEGGDALPGFRMPLRGLLSPRSS